MMVKTNRLAIWVMVVLLVQAVAGCGVIDLIKARQLARDGNALYLASDYRGAIDKYKTALALDPECPNLYLNLGYSYFSVYDPDSATDQERTAAVEAVKAFEEHLKRNPLDENARVFLIKILLKAAPTNKDLADQANRMFLEMLEKNPADHEARQYLTTLFIDAHRYDDAVNFFGRDLEKKPDDIETMKILAIIADKSDRIQDAVDWYKKRAAVVQDPEQQAILSYETGTYAWNLIHYQPNRAQGAEAIKLIDQGIESARKAIKLKDKYAEAMVYVNLLYLKRALFETDEVARNWDHGLAFEFRSQASIIMGERKKAEEEKKAGEGQGTTETPPGETAKPSPDAG